jgi:hypothetical protein
LLNNKKFFSEKVSKKDEKVFLGDKMLFAASSRKLLFNNIKFLQFLNASTHTWFAHLVINSIGQTMDLYGTNRSVGNLYGTMVFEGSMTLDEMRHQLQMSKQYLLLVLIVAVCSENESSLHLRTSFWSR